MSASLLLRPRTALADDFGWLQKLCENLGEAMCDFLASHQKVEAKVQSVAEALYSEWYPSQPAFSLLMPFALGKDAGELVLVVPGQFISQILDVQYGGLGKVPERQGFSTSEMRLAMRLNAHLLSYVNHALLGAIPEAVNAQPIQTDLQAFNLPQGQDNIIMAKIDVECSALGSNAIHAFIGYAQAKKIAMRFADANPNGLSADPEWKDKMRNAALRVPLPMRAILTQADVPVSRLLSLRPGDILPVMLPADVPLLVAGRRFARGTIGEANGRTALKIENMEGSDHE
ncbi:MAG: FliM/FliN family flagellar motor switch protein [Sphingomonadaceae bacterium]|nr:FliM/FliN family flagellar motor switch protein [Sphingomonadaceae bacterium]